MIKLVVLDLDHTTLNHQRQLTLRTKTVISACLEKGVKVTLATGRAFELAKPYALELGIQEPLILNNGALVKSLDGKILYAKTLSKPVQEKLLTLAETEGFSYTFYAEDGFYTSPSERLDFYQAWNQTYAEAQIKLHIHHQAKTFFGVNAYKLLIVIKNEKDFEKHYKHLKKTQEAHVTKSQEAFLDILPKDVNKGTALEILLKKYNLNTEEVLVI